ncbi:hypothetical protein BKA62DRAFT_754750 [Auriculariales sp. MPI-PUGE-AT-0066]|nr:hypothetical protein BKA62DRAFT_754750 [Auriculariales sp. MPI-PUGE-AT-0066]
MSDVGPRPILLDDEGNAAKFFVQKDLPATVLTVLREQIPAYGGIIIDRVPTQGFVLIDPESAEGQRLLSRWVTPEKPNRRIVPVTFVAACINVNGILPPIFVTKLRDPLQCHIHESVRKSAVRERAMERIWHSGGDPTAEAEDADVIIVDDADDAEISKLRQAYIKSFRDPPRPVRVEGVSWIKRCINSGVLRYSRVPIDTNEKQPGVKKQAKTSRQVYTPEDDNCLIAYIARRIPNKKKEGRLGNKLYQELCEDERSYPWAAHHPWSSWRERYKKCITRMDPLIDQYVAHHNIDMGSPVADEPKGPKKRRGRKPAPKAADVKPLLPSPSEDEVDELMSTADGDFVPSDPSLRPDAASKQQPEASTSKSSAKESSLHKATRVKRKPGVGPRSKVVQDAAPARIRPRDSWGSETDWAIRVGHEDNNKQPTWAKRKRTYDEVEHEASAHADAAPFKRQRTDPDVQLEAKDAAKVEKPAQHEPPADEGSVTEDSADEGLVVAPAAASPPTLQLEDLKPDGQQPASIERDRTLDVQLTDGGDSQDQGSQSATQELIALHRQALTQPPRRAPQPAYTANDQGGEIAVVRPEPADVDELLQRIAERHRFFAPDVAKVYARTQDLVKTEAICRKMREAADGIMADI